MSKAEKRKAKEAKRVLWRDKAPLWEGRSLLHRTVMVEGLAAGSLVLERPRVGGNILLSKVCVLAHIDGAIVGIIIQFLAQGGRGG